MLGENVLLMMHFTPFNSLSDNLVIRLNFRKPGELGGMLLL